MTVSSSVRVGCGVMEDRTGVGDLRSSPAPVDPRMVPVSCLIIAGIGCGGTMDLRHLAADFRRSAVQSAIFRFRSMVMTVS